MNTLTKIWLKLIYVGLPLSFLFSFIIAPHFAPGLDNYADLDNRSICQKEIYLKTIPKKEQLQTYDPLLIWKDENFNHKHPEYHFIYDLNYDYLPIVSALGPIIFADDICKVNKTYLNTRAYIDLIFFILIISIIIPAGYEEIEEKLKNKK